ncbi:hypothetical protein J2D73_10185 [Acetobacter sacchari]|uniref:Uncharacterized protein n=1 Tax=Acetobacter sacchari TaxID=2661687 RepID=A0ABS3LWC1_9PROT|nr:hypothetical protein [Acetobacter sacchari]MBO1360166.1 hypothetical protein [Acetobacter sacchari]
MAQPTFRLSVRPSSGRAVAQADLGNAPCACCGLPLVPTGEHWADAADILVCRVCSLLQSLDRPTIDREAILIWCPELDQGQIFALAAHAHLALFRSGGRKADVWRQLVATLAAGQEPGLLTPQAVAAVQAYRTLFMRSDEAFRRLQSTAPGHVATALLMADVGRKDVAEGVEFLLSNLKLLPLGRLYDGADDIYPDILMARERVLSHSS